MHGQLDHACGTAVYLQVELGTDGGHRRGLATAGWAGQEQRVPARLALCVLHIDKVVVVVIGSTVLAAAARAVACIVVVVVVARVGRGGDAAAAAPPLQPLAPLGWRCLKIGCRVSKRQGRGGGGRAIDVRLGVVVCTRTGRRRDARTIAAGDWGRAGPHCRTRCVRWRSSRWGWWRLLCGSRPPLVEPRLQLRARRRHDQQRIGRGRAVLFCPERVGGASRSALPDLCRCARAHARGDERAGALGGLGNETVRGPAARTAPRGRASPGPPRRRRARLKSGTGTGARASRGRPAAAGPWCGWAGRPAHAAAASTREVRHQQRSRRAAARRSAMAPAASPPPPPPTRGLWTGSAARELWTGLAARRRRAAPVVAGTGAPSCRQRPRPPTGASPPGCVHTRAHQGPGVRWGRLQGEGGAKEGRTCA